MDGLTLEPGYLVFTLDGKSSRYAIADVLRAADIPTDLTYVQVGAIKTLASLVGALVKTLIEKEYLPEDFMEEDGYDLDSVIDSLEDQGGQAFSTPDLSGVTT